MAAHPRRGVELVRSPQVASALLILVLVAFGLLVGINNSQVASALRGQHNALAIDNDFTQARLAVANEALAVRTYRVESSTINLRRVRATLVEADTRIQRALVRGQVPKDEAERLLAEQRTLVSTANAMVEFTLNGDDDARRVADVLVPPAYYVLKADLDRVAGDFHDRAQLRLADLQTVQRKTTIAQAIGGALLAVVVGGLLRMLMRYQRNIREQAHMHQYDASHDALTGLPNRGSFSRTLNRAIDEAERGEPVAVALIDLDDFKQINDLFGHRAGDVVLAAVADTLRASVGPADLVARLGGDEFAVILRGLAAKPAGLEHWGRGTAAALRRQVAAPDIDTAIDISGSVGASAVEPGDDAASVTHRADQAMYHAKVTPGCSSWVIRRSDPARQPDVISGELLIGIRRLIDAYDPGRELILHYQPQLDLADGRVRCVETLVRWQHPERGLLQPDAFLALALTPDLQSRFSLLIIERVLAELAQVRRHVQQTGLADESFTVAINLTAAILAVDGMVDQVQKMMNEAAIDPSWLRIEISQLDASVDLSALESAISALRVRGTGTTLDNFGLGTGELDALQRLSIDQLKLDRSFVVGRRGAPPDDRVLAASAALAHSLGLLAAAQGAEDSAMCERLARLGFDLLQGQHLAHPVRSDELINELDQMQSRRRDGAALPQGPD